MKKLGHVFRSMRVAKNLSLKDIAQGDISISFLSKFERDESDISLSKFYALLNNINVTIEEFTFIANDYKLLDQEILLDDIKDAYESNNIILLEKYKNKELDLFKQTKSPAHKLNSIMIGAIIHTLDSSKGVSQEDRTYISDYLLSIDTWGYFEIVLFGNSMNLLTMDSMIILSKEILKKTKMYMNLRVNRQEVIRILLNALIYCIEGERYTDSLYFIKTLEDFLKNKDLFYEKTKLLFIRGVFDIKTNKVDIGTDHCKKAIQIMYDLGSVELAINHEEYLENFLSK